MFIFFLLKLYFWRTQKQENCCQFPMYPFANILWAFNFNGNIFIYFLLTYLCFFFLRSANSLDCFINWFCFIILLSHLCFFIVSSSFKMIAVAWFYKQEAVCLALRKCPYKGFIITSDWALVVRTFQASKILISISVFLANFQGDGQNWGSHLSSNFFPLSFK